MYFYHVLVASPRYHGSEPLTYAAHEELSAGTITLVPFGHQQVLGVILKATWKPDFQTKNIIEVLHKKPLPNTLLRLHEWLASYYPGPLGFCTQLFLPGSLATKPRNDLAKNQAGLPSPAMKPKLTDEQQKALSIIRASSTPVLLHGETGSGKTRVYVELASDCLRSGKSAIILTPEIGLTPQMTTIFETAFPGQVITVHSTQSPATRRRNWLRIHESSEPLIVIGPRSALFAPLDNVGLIVLDEAHDNAYKQEQMPYYQTSRVAAHLANIHNSQLLLGTATPLVHDYFTFTQKKLPIVRMTEAAAGGRSDVHNIVIDMTERESFSRSPWISDQMINEVEKAIQSKQQSLLFLNRRGTARVVLCKNCAWQALCPRCDLPLTYHGDSHKLRCHTCGYTSSTPAACPECQSADIRFKSIGTKTIVSEAESLFPSATIMRFDSDNTRSESIEAHFDAVQAGKVDILVGTQMLAKGLDLPKLRTVGIVAADSSLYFPDYTAEERTFQMLRQVIGRVGRGHVSGTIVVQSYHPQSAAIQAAINKDYESFYVSQLSERELYRFPPFYFVLKVSVERAVQSSAARAAQDLAASLLSSGLAIDVVGPAPSYIEKAHGKYRWQIVVKAKKRTELTSAIKILPKNCLYDIDPTNLL